MMACLREALRVVCRPVVACAVGLMALSGCRTYDQQVREIRDIYHA